MLKQGGFFYWLKIIIILAMVGAGFFCTQKVWAAAKININTATLAELDTLPGIGAVKAQAIIDYRAIKPFEKIEDIKNVSGIGEVTFNNIKDLITVGEPANSQNTATSTPSVESPAVNQAPSEPANPAEAVEATPLAAERINKLGEVVINEFVSDPADNEVEWIELLNKSGEEINLTGWRLEDGSKAKTNMSGVLAASGADRYKIIEKPAGNLNNAGDIIILYDATGKIIDQVAYGDWNDGYLADNAPVARDPDSVARKYDGYNTFNNANDFAVTLKPTKGAANIIESEAEVNSEAKAGFDFSNDIYLTEILPNPTGDDTKLEFIEIYNAGSREVNLTGWSLSNENDKKVNLEKIATSSIIKAGEYLAFFRPRTKMVLRNDRGEVKLYEPFMEKPAQTVKYKNVKEGWSYNLTPLTPLLKGGEWVWSEIITPGSANIIKAVNHAPEVEFNSPAEILVGKPIIFDGSDTIDQDDDELKYAWDFGDGFKNNLASPEHTYFKAGIYEIKLEASDGKATSTMAKSVRAVNNLNGINDAGEIARPNDARLDNPVGPAVGQASSPEAPRNGSIIINEIMPNPAGADTGKEWLELKNHTEDRINLINWRVENGNGKYKFKNDLRLEAGAFYVLNNIVSKLAFKNTDDVVSLYNDLDELIDQVEYAQAVQGEAYARGANGKWFWTTAATPGNENKISLAGSKSGIMNNESGIMGKVNTYIETDLEKIRELEIGSLIKVKGTVAVEPGVLGVQIFYIVGSPGLQIYNYKKDFPDLHVGDYIEASGELTEAQGEFRLKTKDKSDISLIEHKIPPIALAVKGDEASEENIGRLITIAGEITDKKSSSLYLDDGSDEILVYIKQTTGIDAKNLAAGQKISATGILSKTQTGLRLLPRYQGDIVLIDSTGELTPQVLGETVEAAEWELVARNKKLELFKYLLIIAGGIIIVLAGLLIKVKIKN